MPDNRYSGYDQRPVQGGNKMQTGSGAASRPRSAQPARPGGSPQTGAARPRPVNQPSGAQSRPAGASGSRPSGGASAAQRSAQPRPQGTNASRPRPAQTGAQPQQRSQYAPVRQTAPAQSRARTGAPARRPAQRQSGYQGASNGGYGMHPAAKAALFVLVVALMMTASVIIADKVISAQPRLVITVNASDPALSLQAANAPVNPASAPVQPADAPVNPTDAPVQATDAPVISTDAPVNASAAPTAPVNDPSGTGRSATIRAIGDVIVDKTTLDNCAIVKDEEYDFAPLFELVGGVMGDADWTMINIEATLRKHKYGYMGYPQFCTPRSILEDLKAVGVDMLTMCNNHALDGWYDGLKLSLDYADEAGLAHVGAYRTQQEFDTPEVYDIGGIKVGMLNYTQYTNGMAEKSDKEATEYGMRLMSGADYEGDIADLKNAGAEFTIAIMHWGEEYIREPEESIRAVARRLVAAGADLVIGGHPHVVQPVEYITATQADGTSNTALVVYSIGNFFSEHRHENMAYTDNGVIFEFTLSENASGEIEMSAPAFIPVYMWHSEGAGAYEFRAVPSGVYLNNPPAGMSGSEYERMVQSYYEIVDLVGGVIEVKAD